MKFVRLIPILASVFCRHVATAFRSEIQNPNEDTDDKTYAGLYDYHASQPKSRSFFGFLRGDRQQRNSGSSSDSSNDRECSSRNKCDLCESDCEQDDDCKGQLKCYKRESEDPIPIGCEGKISSSRDFCYDPYFESKPSLKTMPTSDFCEMNTCSACEGDCGSDDHCKGDYKCFHRKRGQSVPGCSGGNNDMSENDFCYNPAYTRPTPPIDSRGYPEINDKGDKECSVENPCGLCTGDCQSDDDCLGRLVCHKRGANQVVPGCRGGTSDSSGTDYCVLPSDSSSEQEDLSLEPPKLKNGGAKACSRDEPCGVCEGDCDNDEQCEARLICFARNATEEVPGCRGGDEDTSPHHFCIEKFSFKG